MVLKRRSDIVNRCKFLNIILTLCGLSNTTCWYMADPASCPSYDEPFRRSFVDNHSGEIAQAESRRTDMEVESLNEFVNRTEDELTRMGIAIEREDEAPEWF